MNSKFVNYATSGHERLEVMNFLNEVAAEYPEAISFASGRPQERFFHMDELQSSVDIFAAYWAEKENLEKAEAKKLIGQYGRTAGCINELVTKQLAADENISCSAQHLLVTNGCQEALTILLLALKPDQVLLVPDPCYIGFSGIAEVLNRKLAFVPMAEGGLKARDLSKTIADLKEQGKSIGAFYIIPEFDNPSGESISTEERQKILSICATERIFILEDNPYGMFRYEGSSQPSLFQMDEEGVVFYIGSYAKVLNPALRIGFIVAPNIMQDGSLGADFIRELSKIKSLVSVNTGQINQAIVGGTLLQEECSLKNRMLEACEYYKTSRDIMLDTLADNFAKANFPISWNHPEGGFFITVNTPIQFDSEALVICAEKYGILCMPISFFCNGTQKSTQVRLSFSYVEHDDIVEGIRRFSAFIYDRVNNEACA